MLMDFCATLSRLFDIRALKDTSFSDLISFTDKFYAKPIVVVVGTNPSRKSPTKVPFAPETKSGTTVRSWFKDFDGCVLYRNLYDDYTKDNKTPDKTLCHTALGRLASRRKRGHKIIACGSFVDKVLTEAKIDHFTIPHPSGLCRFWNDKVAGEAKIKEMIEWTMKQQ